MLSNYKQVYGLSIDSLTAHVSLVLARVSVCRNMRQYADEEGMRWKNLLDDASTECKLVKDIIAEIRAIQNAFHTTRKAKSVIFNNSDENLPAAFTHSAPVKQHKISRIDSSKNAFKSQVSSSNKPVRSKSTSSMSSYDSIANAQQPRKPAASKPANGAQRSTAPGASRWPANTKEPKVPALFNVI